MPRHTKSDWFTVEAIDGTIYKLEIFGVTHRTKHCMRLLKDGQELEVFHLDDVYWIRRQYSLARITSCIQQNLPFTRQKLMENSKQLQQEGLGFKAKETINLVEFLKRRRNE